MAGIKYSNIAFFFSNIFSRMLIPFSLIIYNALRKTIGVSISPPDTWIISCFSLVFFFFLQSSTLKNSRVRYRRKDLWLLGLTWFGLAILAHSISFVIITTEGGLYTQYCICTPWPYVLLGLLFAPKICSMTLRHRFF
jgi:hypothetical protein